MGDLLVALGRSDEAESAYRSALALDASAVPAAVNLADLYRRRGDEAQAEAVLREALARSPSNSALEYALALSLIRQGRKSEALALLASAAKSTPVRADIVYTYAVALADVGRRDEAIDVLEANLVPSRGSRDVLLALVAFHRDRGIWRRRPATSSTCAPIRTTPRSEMRKFGPSRRIRDWESTNECSQTRLLDRDGSGVDHCVGSERGAAGRLRDRRADQMFATAGRQALARDASTAYSNPAGMTRLKQSTLQVGIQPVYGDVRFDPDAETTTTGGDGGQIVGFVPTLGSFYVHSFTDRIKAGFALNAYLGGGLEYDNKWAGRYFAQDSILQGLAGTMSGAYRVNDWLSIGRLNTLHTRSSSPPRSRSRPAAMRASPPDTAFALAASVLFELSPTTARRPPLESTSRWTPRSISSIGPSFRPCSRRKGSSAVRSISI
jgi:hypothetical protein